MADRSSLRNTLAGARIVGDRRPWILERAKGRRVVHVGCTDAGFLEDKLDQDSLLHAHLARTCSDLIGVDIDRDGIEKLRSTGFENVFCADIGTDHTRIIDEVGARMGGCDLIVCGEVLEHVLNYAQFLEGVRQLALPNKAQVIISVPNAFSVESFLHVILGVEYVHPDHKCYFSQVTLNTLLNQTGFRTLETYFCSRDRAGTRLKKSLKRVITKTLFAVRPQLAEGLIVVAVPDEGRS